MMLSKSNNLKGNKMTLYRYIESKIEDAICINLNVKIAYDFSSNSRSKNQANDEGDDSSLVLSKSNLETIITNQVSFFKVMKILRDKFLIRLRINS